jgi:protein translocase SecG subunit
MMTFLIVIFTILLIVDSLLLTLLVLIQLPKKEAGVGMAFGGGAADALFGAGSGTALSNLTKYTAIAFFVLVFALSLLNNHARPGTSDLKRELEKQSALPTPSMTAAPEPKTAPASSAPVIPLTITTNSVPATTPLTNSPAAPAK